MNIYRYYVYAYLREDGTPYYIGKGTKNRAWNNHKGINKPPHKNRIIILKNNLTEQESIEAEINFIKIYGRKDLNTGILLNRTNGGEGGDTLSNHPEKEKIIKKIAESNKNSEKHKKFGKNNPNWGNKYSHTEKTKKLISEKISGRKLSEEQKKKLSDRKKKITVIKGLEFESRTEAAKYFNVSVSTITYMMRRKK